MTSNDVYQQSNEAPAISTGFPALDALIGGFHAGELVLIGSLPGAGKSALVLQFIDHAVSKGNNVLVLTPQMSMKEQAARRISRNGSVVHKHIASGRLDTTPDAQGLTEMDRASQAVARLNALPGHYLITEDYKLTVEKIREHVMKASQQITKDDNPDHTHLDMIAIDTLNWIKDKKRFTDQHYEGRAEVCQSLRLLAGEFHVPILLTEGMNFGDGAAPRLEDFHGGIETVNVADTVLVIRKAPGTDQFATTFDLDLQVAKSRYGTVGDVPLRFTGPYVRFDPRDNQ